MPCPPWAFSVRLTFLYSILCTISRVTSSSCFAMMADTTQRNTRKRNADANGVPIRKFLCGFEGCGRSFTRSEHLQRHLLNHTAGENTCERCRAHFKRRDLLGESGVRSISFSVFESGRILQAHPASFEIMNGGIRHSQASTASHYRLFRLICP